MEIPTYLLLVLGCLGAADIALFHSMAHGIRSHVDSVAELVTHSLRGPTYAVLFLVIPNFELHGLFAWGLMGLFVLDVGISIWDFSLERESRRFLGGLPSGEYVLHMLMAIVFGALAATYIQGGNSWFAAPTRWIYAPAGVPVFVRIILAIMAIGVLASGIQDAAAALRLRALGHRPKVQENSLQREIAAITAFPHSSETKARGPQDVMLWMRVVLVAAGIYNLLWAGWVVCFPGAFFTWGGMPPINYPQIWQCVGMIVGVYGIGYLIAAKDPLRHWPIILVGLIGKILGPMGMWWSVAEGRLPTALAWVCVTNDLIWWVPFAGILWRVRTGSRLDSVGLSHPQSAISIAPAVPFPPARLRPVKSRRKGPSNSQA